jgi:hypothetical protein
MVIWAPRIFGWRVWPGVALAALAVHLPISTNGLAAAATAAGGERIKFPIPGPSLMLVDPVRSPAHVRGWPEPPWEALY